MGIDIFMLLCWMGMSVVMIDCIYGYLVVGVDDYEWDFLDVYDWCSNFDGCSVGVGFENVGEESG